MTTNPIVVYCQSNLIKSSHSIKAFIRFNWVLEKLAIRDGN